MTREGQEPKPEDTLTPPASTRWGEGSGPADEEIAAPFIPGRRPAGSPREGAEGGSGGPTPEPEAPEAHATGGEGSVGEAPRESAEEPYPFDAPWSEEASGEESAEVGAGGMVDMEATEAEDPFPVEAFDIEPEPAGDVEDAYVAAGRGGAATPAEELAERLERLAARLRTEGAEGVERELASSDRLTSLLAALLAGHLASR